MPDGFDGDQLERGFVVLACLVEIDHEDDLPVIQFIGIDEDLTDLQFRRGRKDLDVRVATIPRFGGEEEIFVLVVIGVDGFDKRLRRPAIVADESESTGI